MYSVYCTVAICCKDLSQQGHIRKICIQQKRLLFDHLEMKEELGENSSNLSVTRMMSINPRVNEHDRQD